MTRYLLDTNIVSETVKPVPSPALTAWLGAQLDEELFISALTLAELRRGVLQLPAGRRRRDLDAWFTGPAGPMALFAGRILAFDERAALIWARLMAVGRSRGRPRSAMDMMIAAVAEANGCAIATANDRDFAGLKIFNPTRP